MPSYSIVNLPCNAQDTGKTLRFIDHWLAQRPQFSAILWNNGLWDIGFWGIDNNHKSAAVTSPEDYRKNLLSIGTKIKTKTQHPIFVLNTDVPPQTPYRSNADIVKYNEIAKEVMQELKIPVVDLYSFSHAHPELHLKGVQGVGDVHFTESGYKLLGDAVLQELAAEGMH